MPRKNRKASIDLGLAILMAMSKDRRPISDMHISLFCECSRNTISQIMTRAIRKLRYRIRLKDIMNNEMDS